MQVFLASSAAFASGEIGQSAPEVFINKWFTANPPQIKNLTGRVCLLEFWATWCRPCVESVPDLNKLYDEYAPKGLELIALSQDYSEDKLATFVKAQNIRYSVALDNGTVDLYGITGYPTTVLINHTGQIVWRGHPWTRGLEKQTKKALSNAPAPHLAGIDLGCFKHMEKDLTSTRHFIDAYKTIEAATVTENSATAQTAKAIIAGINANVQRQINIADSLREISPKKARKLYGDIIKKFGKLPLTKTAVISYLDMKKTGRRSKNEKTVARADD